ncbi:hypothetical protein [Desulfovibrio sp. UCD-KL4C]|uniref:hypothetical protein n=1 Tax=Desulfovibrio sp. UCD-KL4C TaxID=2578120 RepID=UPI0025C6A235|nr:hypothetical protein [Desulfovibrio sp. UCD-KL4C]
MGIKEINIVDAHEAIVQKLKEAFPKCTVGDYRRETGKVVAPALALELSEIEPSDSDPGTGQLEINMRWVVYPLIHFRVKNAAREVAAIVCALAKFIDGNRFGLPVSAAKFVGGYPEDFKPAKDGYEEWRVEFEFSGMLGESVWTGEGITPETVFLGYTPLIGAENIEEYEDVTGQPLPAS